MPKIFISYRRDDSEFASHAICTELRRRFGSESVFMDVDTLLPGLDFREHLNVAVQQCDVLLAVIGPHWLNIQSKDGKRRLDSPRDFVRIEIEAALTRNIPVIPVLLGRAQMPDESELPPSLAKLAYRQAVEVRSGRDLPADIEQLIRGIERLFDQKRVPAASPTDTVKTQTPTTARPNEEPPTQTVTESIIENSIGMKFARIPAGTFLMGSSDSDEMARGDEKPQHPVAITKSFYLGLFSVTQAEYAKVTGNNPSYFKGNDRRPVECVNWVEAIQFCKKLSEIEKLTPYYAIVGDKVSIVGGRGYRLPTEAEWEYGCRAGSTTKWCFGDDESQLGDFAWFLQNAEITTHPAGEKQPNDWGLYDMHGNVWEWCWDWYASEFYRKLPAKDPSGPTSGQSRVLRGGSFIGPSSLVRSAYRTNNVPADRDLDIGFRLART